MRLSRTSPGCSTTTCSISLPYTGSRVRVPAAESPFLEAFGEAGFVRDYRSLIADPAR